MTLLDNLPHTGTHTRLKYAESGNLSTRQSPVTIATGIAAWVQNANMREVKEFSKDDEQVTHKVFFNSDPGMRPGDRFTATAGPSHVGEELIYMASTDRSAGLGVLFAGFFRLENNERYNSFS